MNISYQKKTEEHAKKPNWFNSALKQFADTNQDTHEVAVAESVHEGQNLDRKYKPNNLIVLR